MSREGHSCHILLQQVHRHLHGCSRCGFGRGRVDVLRSPAGRPRTYATRGKSTSVSELNALYVDPDCWKRGIGAALESAAGASLVQLGYRHAMLWVLAGNVRAIGFYESQGWGTDGTSRQAEVWGITVEEIRYVRSLDLSATGAPGLG